MTRRLFGFLLFAAVGAVCLALWLWQTAPTHRVTKEAFDELKIDMTESDVERVLSGEGLVDAVAPVEWMDFHRVQVAEIMAIAELNPKVTKQWVAGDRLICVTFAEGRAVGLSYCRFREDWIAKVKRWFFS
jgi:hypothetical protein